MIVPLYIIQVQLDKHESCIRIKDDQQLVFFPSAFDPIDCQLAKLALLNFCFPSLVKEENGNNFITYCKILLDTDQDIAYLLVHMYMYMYYKVRRSMQIANNKVLSIYKPYSRLWRAWTSNNEAIQLGTCLQVRLLPCC